MKVVFDTNVLISAFLWQKRLKPIYNLIRSGKISPCFSQLTWPELLRVFRYKKFEKQLAKIDITPEEIIKLLFSCSMFVTTHCKISIIKEDPPDNHFLACALAAQASFIVSGDSHLLGLEQFRGIPIVTPKKFLEKFK